MMSDIVDRLRHCSENCGDEYLHELTGKAADTITRLTAEVRVRQTIVEEARDERDAALAEVERLRSLTVVQESLIRKAEAESEKLRSALLVAHKYVLVQSCGLSLVPKDAARDLAIIDEALEEDDD